MQGISHTQISSGTTSPQGTLSGSVVLFSSNAVPASLDTSLEGALDWYIPVTPTMKSAAISKLAGRLATKLSYQGGSQANAGSSSLSVSSDAVDSAGTRQVASANFTACSLSSNITDLGYGFTIEALASSKTLRNLNLYIPFWPGVVGQHGTLTIVASLNDSTAPTVTLNIVDNTGTNASISTYKVNLQFKGGNPNSFIRVQVYVSDKSATSNEFGLQAVTLF